MKSKKPMHTSHSNKQFSHNTLPRSVQPKYLQHLLSVERVKLLIQKKKSCTKQDCLKSSCLH